MKNKNNYKKHIMKKTLIAIFAAFISLAGYAQAVKPTEGDTLYLKSAKQFEESLDRFIESMDTLVTQGYVYEAYEIKLRRRALDFMTLHNNDEEGAKFLKNIHYYMPVRTVQYYYEMAGETIKNDPDLMKMKDMWNRKVKTDAPVSIVNYNKFANFSVEYEGKTQKLSDYVGNGKYTLVDFWASWCGPCRHEIPYIKAAKEKYGSDNLTILGVATWDKPEDTMKAIKDLGISWPQIMNAQKVGSDTYGISGIPEIILFSPEGEILARGLRGKLIDAILAQHISHQLLGASDSDFAPLVQYETQPQFPGGDEAMEKFIRENLQYPSKARSARKQGRISCFATIQRDGSITDIRIIDPFNEECAKEAERIVRLMPKWKPGTCCGDIVKDEVFIPVYFEIIER